MSGWLALSQSTTKAPCVPSSAEAGLVHVSDPLSVLPCSPVKAPCDGILIWDPGAQVPLSIPLGFQFLGPDLSHGRASLPDVVSRRVHGLDHWLTDAFNETNTQMTSRPHVPARRLLSPKPPHEKLQATKTTDWIN